jgi:hypothetical protein
MTLNEMKAILPTIDGVTFQMEDGRIVPAHFHVTEVGQITKNFIDCGGVVRKEQVVNFQLWHADDLNHRLKPEKLLHIIELSEQQLGIQNAEIEVEYQTSTIGKYNLAFNGTHFLLLPTQTACLASDACGVPVPKPKVQLNTLGRQTACCSPASGCC